MLKLFLILNGNKKEILPKIGVYNVIEMGNYEMIYENIEIINTNVFIEDFHVPKRHIQLNNNKIHLSCFRYFQDYFGSASLMINDETFLFNIKINKLKLPEIEALFSFLWEKEENLFNLFFSKSVQTLHFQKEGYYLYNSSKLLNFIQYYIDTFERLYKSFKNLSSTCLKNKKMIIDYNKAKISNTSITWILQNIDKLHIDSSLKNHPNSFPISNSYAIIDKIEDIISINSIKTYENEIILGSFIFLQRKIKSLQNEMQSNITSNMDINNEFISFNQLKDIPFIKLFNKLSILKRKIKSLFKKYKLLFKNVQPRIERVKLTPTFINNLSYKKAFILIQNITNYTFKLKGHLKLLNINKLSKLYEVYNYYKIVETIQAKINISVFEIKKSTNRDDSIINMIEFVNKSYKIRVLYETKYKAAHNSNTDLIRIDTRNGTYYNPDFVIEITTPNIKNYIILDAKYSPFNIVKNNHLSKCIFKYILNTGIQGHPYKKIDALALLHPSEKSAEYITSTYYKPTIKLCVSKPKQVALKQYLEQLIEQQLPKEILISQTPQNY
ncbi:MAG: hypothetical protein ACPG5B_11665 [Chitinophagales bacterium]